MEWKAELKSTNRMLAKFPEESICCNVEWKAIYGPVGSVGKMQRVQDRFHD